MTGQAKGWEDDCSEATVTWKIPTRRNRISIRSQDDYEYPTQEFGSSSWVLLRWTTEAFSLRVHEES